MMNLGAKLHIGVNEIVATIKRGLLDHIHMQVMQLLVLSLIFLVKFESYVDIRLSL